MALPFSDRPADRPALCGPLRQTRQPRQPRQPRQMLAEQTDDGHKSIHDASRAAGLGLRAGPIEGPTHFSQFDPLLVQLWGQAWFEPVSVQLGSSMDAAGYRGRGLALGNASAGATP